MATMFCLRNVSLRYNSILHNFKDHTLGKQIFYPVRSHHINVSCKKGCCLLKQYLSRKNFVGFSVYKDWKGGITAIRLASTWPISSDVTINLDSATSPSAGESSASLSTPGLAEGTTNNIIENIAPIPEPPIPPPVLDPSEIIEASIIHGEPSLADLGLGGYWPIGIAQSCFEFLHATCGLPWWGAIALGTVVVRICLFPLVIAAQRNAARMNNYLPEMTMLQMKLSDARHAGNRLEAARYSQELMIFMKEKKVNPVKNMMVPLAQAPIFISVFIGLRRMAYAPVESMKTGGLFWFTDLTVADPLYLLPLLTSATMCLVIEMGTDSIKLSSTTSSSFNMTRYVLRALPIIMFPFIIKFPGAILVYWVSTNLVSLVQVSILRIPKVRKYFNIEAYKKPDESNLPPQKGFVEGIRETWSNSKILRELENRERYDEMRFQQAGQSAIPKTYKFDPTKPRDIRKETAISAKPKD